VLVAARVEELRVDAVDDAVEVVAPLLEERLEALAEFRSEDLLGVALAHGADDVGERDAARHRVDLLAEALLLDEQAIFGNAGELQHALARHALVGKVVDREDRGRLGESVPLPLLEQFRNEAGVPIMRVHDVGAPLRGVLRDG
jgi:hypothetical protein